ncbi:MAG: hypothetical protein LCH46_05130 [Proteobacteria bacterium]|nr:hypothetical protein [Pseudomonadota bacterium]
MVEIAYLAFAFGACLLGAVLGWVGHFWRSHTTFPPEDLGLGEPWDTLTRENYQFEKHVVGAKWDDAGYWDDLSNRNLIYYVASGFAGPLLLAVFFWHERASLVLSICGGLTRFGLSPPLCPVA